MVWLIMAALLLAMLSPLVWLLPSRGQKERMNVRLAARRLGLGVQLVREEWPHWQEAAPASTCAQYHSARAPGGKTWCYWQAAPGQWCNQWREPCEDRVLLDCLALAPADLYRVEAGEGMFLLYWGERGGEAALQRIEQLMKKLQAL